MAVREFVRADNEQPGGITRLVDRMIGAGLAERIADDHDRRVLWVALTDAAVLCNGRRFFAHLSSRWAAAV